MNNHHGIKDNSLIGMVVLGYGATFANDGYLGAELFADWTNHNPTTTRVDSSSGAGDTLIAFNYSSRVKIQPVSYGIDLRPGYQFGNCSLLYGRIGVGVKRISHYINTSETLPEATLNSAFSQGVNRGVIRFGLGFEQAITECLSFRVDYIYSYLGSFSGATSVTRTVDFGDEDDVAATTNGAVKKQLFTNSVLFGLCWHW